jgi:hypothetical protein
MPPKKPNKTSSKTTAANLAPTGWKSILARANPEQTLQRSQTCLGRHTVYQLGEGGNASQIASPHIS